MPIEHTLSIIKPDAIAKNCIGEIFTCFEKNDLKIVAVRMLALTKKQAEAFYSVHCQQPFFSELVLLMTMGPILVQVLCGHDAIVRYRTLIGATDPKKAAPGTIRARFADSIDANAVHGSDSAATAQYEIQFFFPLFEMIHDSH